MDHIHGAYNNGVRNVLAPAPGLIKDIQIGNLGNTVVGLGKDNNLHVSVMSDAEIARTDLIEGPFDCFAIRPNVPEVAVIRAGTAAIERYALHRGVLLCKLPFMHPTALAYKNDGTMMAAGGAYGKVLVWSLEEDGPPRAIVEAYVKDERIVRLYFGIFCLLALTANGRCYRIPFHFATIPTVLVKALAIPRLVAGDGKQFDWNCYTYAGHPTLSLDVFGGECGILVAHQELFGTCGVKQTGLGAYIHNLTFCPATKRLVVMGQKGAQIWTVAQSVMFEKWEVSGALEKLGRAATGIKKLECAFTPPQPGFQPFAYELVDGRPTIFWA
jgi:hypothetical protein